MVQMTLAYEGDLHCRLTHGPSGMTISTDAPVDNQGKGAAFSPTDLLAVSLGACIMTTMAIAARGHGIAVEGMSGEVVKEMVTSPVRRVGKISVKINLPGDITIPQRATLERIAHACPVHRSLHPDVVVEIVLEYEK